MRLEDATLALKKVEKALENISKFKESFESGKKGRKHQRYMRKYLMARFARFEGDELDKSSLIEAPVMDVSAGGMKITLPVDSPYDKGHRIQFQINKEDAQVILRGTGEVVRVEKKSHKKFLGVKFDQVNS